jgi:hypothetical protein
MRNLFDNQYSVLGNNPLISHLTQIRLLCNPQSLITILIEVHSMSNSVARKLSKEVSPFIKQGLAFYETSATAPINVKPLLQYYAYLNFASAIVRIYQPPNWQFIKSHGVIDLTKSRTKIGINAKLVKIYNGVIPIFHSIFSDENLFNESISLKELFSSIFMISVELTDHFNQKLYPITVDHSIKKINNHYHSYIEYNMSNDSNISLPIRRVLKAIPSLRIEYNVHNKSTCSRVYISKMKWKLDDIKKASNFHNIKVLKLVNYGSQDVKSNRENIKTRWNYNPGTRFLPLLSASLILSFAFSSLSRYRANLLSKSENTRLMNIFEVFINESDYFMVPAFRNLFYGNSMYICSNRYV